MRILALETTERIGTVAAMADGNLLSEMELEPKQRSAQSLAPAMMALLKQVGWKPEDVQLVAVAVGPGSFTGLRVGVTAAKVFAYAVKADLLGVDTLETIAAASPDDVSDVAVAMDAQRGQLSVRRFLRQPDAWFAPAGPQELVDIHSWCDGLPAGIAVSGPILAKLADHLPNRVRVLEPRYWSPRASTVARLANRDYALGRRDDLWKLSPRYSRRSAAEEKAAERASASSGNQ